MDKAHNEIWAHSWRFASLACWPLHTFLKGISLKMNIIVLLEFELASYDVTVQLISHYTTGTPYLGN